MCRFLSRTPASGRRLLDLGDAEDDELGRLHRRDADLDDDLALVDRLGRVGLGVALDVERLLGGGAEQRAVAPQAPQERADACASGPPTASCRWARTPPTAVPSMIVVSTMLNSRRTLMYVQSVFDDSVRAPQTRMPRVPNGRMQLMPIGLSRPCSALVMFISTSSAPRTTSLAGAFQTPRVSSVRAQMPAMWPHGGTMISVSPLVAAGFVDLDPRVVQRRELRVVHRRRRCATP